MRIMRLREVMTTTGLPRSTIYRFIANGTFPKPVSLGERCTGWVEEEVLDWVLTKIDERDSDLSVA
ncbi:AlpA family transcriptional regulator [Pseudomonas sp. YH-1]|uniref:AlpA family transcriptional regulator n=1 Tax=Pseudomonas sp. YH-1 TaxID=3384787 RepID=UPI003F7EA25F